MSYVILRKGEVCPKCGYKMDRRAHRSNSTKQFKQPFYFTEWDYCKTCRHVQHYEQYKVFNTG